jgi:HEAT repeat protein
MLVTGAQSKDVRRATAIALGSIKHPLSAYLLLPMLLDGSSRVKQAAFQGLIQLNQPHTMESILAACPCSKSLRSLVVETLRLVSDTKRSMHSLTDLRSPTLTEIPI